MAKQIIRDPEPMSVEAHEYPPHGQYHETDVEPIPVRIVKDKNQPASETIKVATYGSWESWKFLGTAADTPVRILRQDSRRNKAQIYCLPGFVSNNTQGNVYVGTKQQITNGNPAAAGAGIMVSGMKIDVTAEQEVWAMSDFFGGVGHELSLTVHDEIYKS